MVSSVAIAPYLIACERTVPAAHPVVISACPTCDRPKCPNKGCGLPTGALLPMGGPLQPQTCEHCNKAIRFKGTR